MKENYTQELKEQLMGAHRQVVQIEEHMLKHSPSMNISFSELRFLESVDKAGKEGITVRRLADYMGITMPSVTVAIKRLINKGYLEKSGNPEDKRSILIVLTRKGQRILNVHSYYFQKIARRILQDMSDDEKKALLFGIQALNTFSEAELKKLREQY